MRFGKYLIEQSVPEWHRKYLNYKYLKDSLKINSITHDSDFYHTVFNNDPQFESFLHSIESQRPADHSFVYLFYKQLSKVNKFYSVQLEDAEKRLFQLEQQCTFLDWSESLTNVIHPTLQPTPNIFVQSPDHIEMRPHSLDAALSEDEDIAHSEIVVHSTNPKKELTKVFIEFYRMLQMLENYRILNEIATKKILKKFAKYRGIDTTDLSAQANQLDIFQSKRTSVKNLILKTEDLYVNNFGSKFQKRKDILEEIRIENNEVQFLQPVPIWSAGFLTGLSIPPLVAIIVQLSLMQLNSEKKFILLIYGGISIPIMFLYLFSYCMIVLNANRVNWILICELDPKCINVLELTIASLSPIEFTTIAGFMLFIFSYNMYFAICYPFLTTNLQIYPIAKIFLSGLYPVQFIDFFVCDLLSSLTYSFVSIETAICLIFQYPDGESSCRVSESWLGSMVVALPAWWRLLQCCRSNSSFNTLTLGYYDNRLVHPHLTNMLKYVFSLTTISLSIVSKFTDSITIKLREEITFPPEVYYVGIILNGILRFSWIALLSPSYWSSIVYGQLIIYTIAVCEIFRRGFWAVLRMENEHANNVGQFRVVRDLPLPFDISKKQKVN
ncbi:SPX domain-containing protein [Globomyces pollinis-pini]|nr:SPX domain-containing protein [Globomyces pollinis-pini]